MNSEKATAVSPSSSPRARGPSVLDLLWSAAAGDVCVCTRTHS